MFSFAVGILLFVQGFLLTRLELQETSTCGGQQGAPVDDSSCWLSREYDRAVVVVIDALRFNFVQYNKTGW